MAVEGGGGGGDDEADDDDDDDVAAAEVVPPDVPVEEAPPPPPPPPLREEWRGSDEASRRTERHSSAHSRSLSVRPYWRFWRCDCQRQRR